MRLLNLGLETLTDALSNSGAVNSGRHDHRAGEGAMARGGRGVFKRLTRWRPTSQYQQRYSDSSNPSCGGEVMERERKPRREGAETKIGRWRSGRKATAGSHGGEEWHEYYCFFRGENPRSSSRCTSGSPGIGGYEGGFNAATERKGSEGPLHISSVVLYPLIRCTPCNSLALLLLLFRQGISGRFQRMAVRDLMA